MSKFEIKLEKRFRDHLFRNLLNRTALGGFIVSSANPVSSAGRFFPFEDGATKFTSYDTGKWVYPELSVPGLSLNTLLRFGQIERRI